MDKEIIKREVGSNILHLRINRLLWTQDELAFYCDMTQSQIHSIESGKSDFTIFTAKTLATGMEITVSELFDFKIGKEKF